MPRRIRFRLTFSPSSRPTSSATTARRRRRASTAAWNGACIHLPAPIGYLDKGAGVPKALDPGRAPLVKQAFDLYASNTFGLVDLRREMKARGLRSINGKVLSLEALSLMLHNPFYIGLIHIKRTGQTFQGKHPPLVSKATFDRVQAILAGKTFLRLVRASQASAVRSPGATRPWSWSRRCGPLGEAWRRIRSRPH